MDVLRPVVRPYPWGSRHAIAELQGRPVPAPGPEAELWMGGHPSAPSGLHRDGPATLDAVIAADPAAELGPDCVARFGPRLPFLLKVLAAGKALSIQVHPSRAQARAGFAAENERGLAPDDPARNYVDDWPKPELLCALTPFEVLAGLRTPADAAAFLRALATDQLKPLAAQLEAAPGAMSSVLGAILDWPAAGRPGLVADVVTACARLAPGGGPYAAGAEAAVRVAADHPGDIGVVASLLMRPAVLAPGQAMFMPAGGLHAYLRGTGIELLANSDNVIRAGLHRQAPGRARVAEAPRPLGRGAGPHPPRPRGRDHLVRHAGPEFRLYVVDLAGPAVTLPGRGPRVLLCTEGSVLLRSESGPAAELGRGGSGFLSAADGPVRASGSAHLFLASPGPLE